MIQSKNGCLIRVHGTKGEPDYIFLREEPVYVLVQYPDNFYIIPSDLFKLEEKTSLRKSLTESRAMALCIYKG